ncbi:MAG: hypothetical protein OER83_05975 [Flavobacteriaceae bacterium]|nr:hypothetical protein [Flavobacteriaceae bacterium]
MKNAVYSNQNKRKVTIRSIVLSLGMLLLCPVIASGQVLIKEDEKETDEEQMEWFLDESNDTFWKELNYAAFSQDQYFANFSEAYAHVDYISSLQRAGAPMQMSKKCQYAWKLLKKSKCKIPRKQFAKQMVKSIGSGNFSVNEGTVSTPGIEIIKNEINRLNVLIEVLHTRTLNYCNRMNGQCQSAEFIVNCNALEGKVTPEIILNRYEECGSLLKDDSSNFTSALREIGRLVDGFQEGAISADSLKLKINAKLNAVALDE